MRSPSQSQATTAREERRCRVEDRRQAGVDRLRRVGEAEEGHGRVDEADDRDRPPVRAHRGELAARREQRDEQQGGAGDAEEGEGDRPERRGRRRA
jgi:hypothetical protein